jgi:four helix bundle protein
MGLSEGKDPNRGISVTSRRAFRDRVAMDFRRLRVYRESVFFAREVYQATRRFPFYRRKLASQLDDACESIGSNIAEGCGRKNRNHGNAELIRYLHMSFGSANEAQHRLAGAHDRELMFDHDYANLEARIVGIKRMLSALVRSLEDGDRGRQKP